MRTARYAVQDNFGWPRPRPIELTFDAAHAPATVARRSAAQAQPAAPGDGQTRRPASHRPGRRRFHGPARRPAAGGGAARALPASCRATYFLNSAIFQAPGAERDQRGAGTLFRRGRDRRRRLVEPSAPGRLAEYCGCPDSLKVVGRPGAAGRAARHPGPLANGLTRLTAARRVVIGRILRATIHSKLQRDHCTMIRRPSENPPLAIIGMACRLPGADNLDAVLETVAIGRQRHRRNSARAPRSRAPLPSEKRAAEQDVFVPGWARFPPPVRSHGLSLDRPADRLGRRRPSDALRSGRGGLPPRRTRSVRFAAAQHGRFCRSHGGFAVGRAGRLSQQRGRDGPLARARSSRSARCRPPSAKISFAK